MKVRIENIYYLFCYAWDCLPESVIVDVSAVPRPDTLSLFAHVIKKGTEHVLRRGLDHGYATHTQEIQTVRGRIEFTASISVLASTTLRLTCSFDDFVPNVLHNQILRTTIRRLSRSDDIDRTLRAELKGLDQALTGISLVHLDTSVFRRVQVHRNNAFYGFLMRICELLHSASLPDRGEGGQYIFRDVLDDESYMAGVFEKFVRNFYRLEQNDFPLVGSEHLDWHASATVASHIGFLPAMKTDVTLRSASRQVVIETKYYKDALQAYHEKRTVHSQNLYQLMSYLRSSAKGWRGELPIEGILLYPAAASRPDLRFMIEGHPVRICSLDLDQPWQGVCRDLLNLIQPQRDSSGNKQVASAIA